MYNLLSIEQVCRKIKSYNNRKGNKRDKALWAEIVEKLNVHLLSLSSKDVLKRYNGEIPSIDRELKKIRQKRVYNICLNNKWYVVFVIYKVAFFLTNSYNRLMKI